MEKREHTGMRRRPLLTPVWLSGVAALLIVAAIAVFLTSLTTTTVIVVRHAEKELGTIEDPPLTTQGEQRAQLLARMLGTVSDPGKVSGIFATDTRRTQRTVAPLAARLGLTVNVLPARDVDAVVNRIRNEYRGRTVVVSGHSNTVPEIVKRLAKIDEVPPVADEDYGTMYVVTMPTLGPASVMRLTY
jgi:broad specificity phosphatase PhoE